MIATLVARRAEALYRQGPGARARRALCAAAALDPRGGRALAALGELALGRDEAAASLALTARALRNRPGVAPWLVNLSAALQRLADSAAAARAAARAAVLQPGLAQAHGNLGAAWLDLGRRAAAQRALERALALGPAAPRPRFRLGQLHLGADRPGPGVALTRLVLRQTPGQADVASNLGAGLRALGRWPAAQRCYDRALAIDPQFSGAAYNAGNLWMHRGALDRCIAHYRRALRLRPEEAEYHWNLSLALLLDGRWEEGWREYEWRWRWKGFSTPAVARPMPAWAGEPLEGRSILVHAEQGLGDTLQMCRYIPALAGRGARIVLEVQPELVSLLRGQPGPLAKVAVEAMAGAAMPGAAADFHCPMFSLPRLLGAGPAPPYLAAAPDRAAVPVDGRPAVGLVWAGNPGHRRDRERSLDFAALAPLLGLDARFFALQLGPARAQVAAPVRDLGERLTDFAATAGILAALDILVTVDTSVAHLAGALDRPVFLMLPAVPDFRWGLHGTRSFWYPRTRLFRQPAPGAWDPVVQAVKDALAAWISTRPKQGLPPP